MDIKTLMKLDLVQLDLSTSIDLLSVIADGLCFYTGEHSLSGDETQKYVNVLVTVYEKLSATAGELDKVLNRLGPDPNAKGAA